MTKAIPEKIKKIYDTLKKSGFDVYFVGGCVRDILMGLPVKDWDLTTSATPKQILKLFEDGYYNNQFGTVGIPVKNLGIVEITTFRTEHGYSDRRRPDKVSWGKTIEEDLSRRDFTLNAVAMKVAGREVEFIDPFEGKSDIKKNIIRTVGNPKERFKEDALRLMRGVRLAAQLGFDIDEATGKEIKEDSALIKHISAERIRDELLKILSSPDPTKGIMLLKESGLLEFILPELLEGVGVSQARPGRHHTTDVFTHNIMSLKHCPSKDPIVRFAALLHDVGKPKVAGKDKEGLVTFYNHEVSGANIAYEICQRLKFSKKETTKIVTLIRWHMFSVNENLSDAAVRRFIRRIGVENVGDMMDLRIGDRLGGGTQTAESWRLKKFKERVAGELAPKPFALNDLKIDGNDVMKVLNLKPGPRVGEILQKLFEEVDEDLSKNNRNYLLNRIRELQ
ncbi:MAG: CCA tRNA nucleotidyltransferase [Candidatus Levybacteria bacterium]|nr:CCA tRNA nucleotidyltransferase [Candidatus Levybacteria bacterium]